MKLRSNRSKAVENKTQTKVVELLPLIKVNATNGIQFTIFD